MLAVGAGFAEVNLAGVVRQGLAVDADTLAVGLHRHLLDVRRQFRERLRVRQNRASLYTKHDVSQSNCLCENKK